MLDINSLTTENKELTPDEFKEQILPLVQKVLDKEFKDNFIRRKIKIYPDRLNFACPFCGDSAHVSTKKRGNIILRGKYRGIYKCHNCQISMPVTKFFAKYPDCSMSVDAINYSKQIYDSSYEMHTAEETTSLLYDIEAIDELCPSRKEFKECFNLSECGVGETHKGRNYIIGRCQYDTTRFMYDEKNDKLYVLNTTPSGNIFGCQIRDLSGKMENKGMKYISWNITRIRREMGMPEDSESEEYDVLSLIFNALRINYEKPILVTEGPMDSFLLPNCVAMCGGGKKIPLNFKLYFMFDADESGTKYALEKLNEGRCVFMWGKFIKDMNLPQRKKWDWNDVIKYSRQNGLRIPRLIDYFTDDPFDTFLI